MFPGIALVVPLLKIFTDIGWINTYQALILPSMSFALPLSVWNLTAFFRQMPQELEQAAMVDGCTQWQAFRKVIIPLAAPGVFTTAIIAFVAAWNEFIIALTMTNKSDFFTAVVAISQFTGQDRTRHPGRQPDGGGRDPHDPADHHGARLPASHRERPDRGWREVAPPSARRSAPQPSRLRGARRFAAPVGVGMTHGPRRPRDWWRDAVIYQVYIRSFADGDGDGLGDIAGIRSRLPYLADLGVDALWINPWYPSPMADAGYDVADYRDVEPRFGSLAGRRGAARARPTSSACGCCSTSSPTTPRTSTRGSPRRWRPARARPARERYVFRPGRGADGAEPPNDWQSVFGGPAWQRVTEPDGTPGEWYLHLFAPEQPDFNWEHPEVARRLRGDPALLVRPRRRRLPHRRRALAGQGRTGCPTPPDMEWPRQPVEVDGELERSPWQPHPFWDRDEVHEIYRALARGSPTPTTPPRVFVAEAWVDEPERLARYLRARRAAHRVQLPLPAGRRGTPATLRHAIAETLDVLDAGRRPGHLGAVQPRRDAARVALRPGPGRARRSLLQGCSAGPADLELGRRRARAAVLLTLALPGGAYVYQGEELGLPEVEDLPEEVLARPDLGALRAHRARPRRLPRADPVVGHRGRRTASARTARDAAPWLPQPADWAALTVEAETGRPGLDARAVPRRAAAAPRDAGARRRRR